MTKYLPSLFYLLISVFFAALFGCFTIHPTVAQSLSQSRQTSYYTFVYQISNAEARNIFKDNIPYQDTTLFHSLVDMFPTDSVYRKKLPQGHYLFVYTKLHEVVYELVSISRLELKLLDNKSDLSFILTDSLGNPVNDAEVRINSKKIPFDIRSGTYRLPKSNKEGLLTIDYQGFQSYHQIDKKFKNSRFKRIKNAILFRTPIKYVLLPFFWIYNGFRDIYGGIKHGQVPYFMQKIAGWFRPNDKYKSGRFKGYLAFNQPKYQPGDTIRFKAFINKKRGKPLSKPIEVNLAEAYKTHKKLMALNPYRPGAYEGTFVLTDSLGLKIDQRYYLYVNNKDNQKTYLSGHFYYEDYELEENTYTMHLASDQILFHPMEAVEVFLQGKDANELNLLDARVKILVRVLNSHEYLQNRVFVKDTLWKYEQKLDDLGETKILLPDSIFPEAHLELEIEAIFTNSSQERQTKKVNFSYSPLKTYLKLELKGDTLQASYISQNQNLPKTGILTAYSSDNKSYSKKVQLPYAEKINPHFAFYRIAVDSLKDVLQTDESTAQIQCFSERTADSVFIQIDNPQNLPFWYGIYRKNRLIKRGYDTSLNFQKQDKSAQKYFVSLQYIWAGLPQEDEYVIPIHTRQLNILVNQPERIYPGEKVKIDIAVKDYQDKPVPNVDLTAYAFTHKFKEAAVPQAPNFEKRRKDRVRYNHFTENLRSFKNQKRYLDWQYWNTQMQLDSITFYQFLYPEQGVFFYELPTQDSLTQFAPFVTGSRGLEPVHIIYLDDFPIYFSGTNVLMPYSFAADSGYHHIRLRTAFNTIVLDSVYFRSGQKLILSVDPFKNHPQMKTMVKEHKLDKWEMNDLSASLMPVRNDFGDKMAYLVQGTQVQWINAENKQGSTIYKSRPHSNTGSKLAGPFRQWGMKFVLKDGFETDLEFEPGFSYEFKKELLKMCSFQHILDQNLNSWEENIQLKLSDRALTEAYLDSLWVQNQHEKEYKKAKYNLPQFTQAGFGRLLIDFQAADSIFTKPIFLRNLLLFKSDISDFIRINPGGEPKFNQLAPDLYQLFLLMSDASYFVIDSVQIQANGLNYLRVTVGRFMPADTFSRKVLEIILKQTYSENLKDQEALEIKKLYNQNQSYPIPTGFNRRLVGQVLDETGSGIPGINVVIKGTVVGTVTDREGRYEISGPPGAVLVFSSVGFESKEINTSFESYHQVQLDNSVQQLGELVVVGYSINEKRSVTGSISTVSANNALQGRVAGVAVTQASKILPSKADETNPTASGPKQAVQQAQENDLLVIQEGSLRNNFKDYAYWKPRLKTDREGKVSFEATFPDDVTQWRGIVLASGRRKLTGVSESKINAYKDLSGALALPRFLVEGDEAEVIGKVLNHLRDTVEVETFFEVNGTKQFQRKNRIVSAQIDSLRLQTPVQDSLEVKYFLRKSDGYTDGEQRKIPILKKGSLESEGDFFALQGDTTLSILGYQGNDKLKITALANELDILQDEIRYVRGYRHLCNEQIASKVKCLLAQKKIDEQLGRKFTYNQEIRTLIRKLEKAQKSDGTWGWWTESPTEKWISQHVAQALTEARKAGFSVQFDEYRLTNYFKNDLDLQKPSQRISSLWLLSDLNSKVNFTEFIQEIEQDTSFRHGHLNDKLHLIALKQKLGIPYTLDTLNKYRQTTLLGNYYWGKEGYHPCDNTLYTTLLVYRILQKSPSSTEELLKTRNYFIEKRQRGYWQNTYLSSLIVEALLPDLLAADKSITAPRLQLSGALNREVIEFPFEVELEARQNLQIQKTGTYPVYLGLYRQSWNAEPEKVEKDFGVRTYFEDSISHLQKGKPIRLFVEVDIKKAADYVHLEVPIPAGCTYAAKPKSYAHREVYREYFQHQTAIFCDRLEVGKYTFVIPLLARYSGKYTLNPAKVEQMYFPIFYGRNEMKVVKVE
ncbi:MAG: alpha-2-macroglobulin family protein [Microscillaceae bacterium]|nr:alpha-2-macroglobulin family protein [Microscillaceae bacterium]